MHQIDNRKKKHPTPLFNKNTLTPHLMRLMGEVIYLKEEKRIS